MFHLYRNLIEKYPLDMWEDLIECIKNSSYLRPFIKGDDFILYLIKDFKLASPDFQDLITLRITKENVSMEIQYKKDPLIKDFHKLIIETPVEQLALYINHKNTFIRELVKWRLKNSM